MLSQRTGSCLRVTVTDDPIFAGSAFSQRVIAQLAEGDRELILDLHLVTALHSPGLANLVAIYVTCGKRGIALRLAAVSPFNRRLLATTHLDRLLPIDD